MILRYKDKIIGGALIYFQNICSIHLSSSVKQYFNFPNIIIRDALIEFCFKKIEFIHFGGEEQIKKMIPLKFKEKF